ncbi:helix-turn-helix domain-containing protein [Micromonospora sp. NPDC003241]
MSGELLPIGRRVAYWRGRRRMSQQVFADRLGKSKSWVDKVERGARSLDKVSTIVDVAAVLGIDQSVLLGRDTRTDGASGRPEGVERIRETLSTYDVVLGRRASGRDASSTAQVARTVEHAWTTYQYARYPDLIRTLPELLTAAQRGHALDPSTGRGPLVEAYRVTASLLVKLDEGELAWLAADRAMAVAVGDPVLVAAAAVQLVQVLRSTGRARLAASTSRSAAYRIAPPDLDGESPACLSLCGTLLVQAALAAAGHGDEGTARALLGEAADLAARVGEGRDHYRTAFGPAAVAAARMLAAVACGDGGDAVVWHHRVVSGEGWRWLPVEHRAAYLIDAARAHLQVGDPVSAARIVLEAERTAPAEVRHRPAARDVLAQLIRSPDTPTTVVQLAVALRVSGV